MPPSRRNDGPPIGQVGVAKCAIFQAPGRGQGSASHRRRLVVDERARLQRRRRVRTAARAKPANIAARPPFDVGALPALVQLHPPPLAVPPSELPPVSSRAVSALDTSILPESRGPESAPASLPTSAPASAPASLPVSLPESAPESVPASALATHVFVVALHAEPAGQSEPVAQPHVSVVRHLLPSGLEVHAPVFPGAQVTQACVAVSQTSPPVQSVSTRQATHPCGSPVVLHTFDAPVQAALVRHGSALQVPTPAAPAPSQYCPVVQLAAPVPRQPLTHAPAVPAVVSQYVPFAQSPSASQPHVPFAT